MPHLAIAKRTYHFVFLATVMLLMSVRPADAQQAQNAHEVRGGTNGVGVLSAFIVPDRNIQKKPLRPNMQAKFCWM